MIVLFFFSSQKQSENSFTVYLKYMLCSFWNTVHFSFQAAVNVLALGIFIMTEGLKDAVVKDTEGGRLAFKLSVLVPSCLNI